MGGHLDPLLYTRRTDCSPLMLKTTVQKVIRETVGNTVLSKEQKQQVFNNVCFNLMKEGRISSIQYERWTTAF
jgi:hypothetical protein